MLIAGGALNFNGTRTSRAEIYDSAARLFSTAGPLVIPRSFHVATRLQDGSALVIGGSGTSGEVGSAERFDPTTGAFAGVGTLAVPRTAHTATLLNDGTVLVVGGSSSTDAFLRSAELYSTPLPDPLTLQISPTSVTLHLGETRQFSVIDDQGHQRFDAVWSVSDPTRASITTYSTATLTGLAYGVVTVAATIQGVSAQATVMIAPRSLQVTPANMTMLVGESRELGAVDEFGRPVLGAAWTVSPPNVVTITSGGPTTISALAAGQATITATVTGVSASAVATVLNQATFDSGTTLWSVPSLSGLPHQQTVQAVTNGDGPDLYDVSTDGTIGLIRAFSADGRQVWQASGPPANGRSVPDAFGGIIVTNFNGCDQTNPMTIVDVDRWGNTAWQITGLSSCTIDAPAFALRRNGDVVVATPGNLSGFPELMILDGRTGVVVQAPAIPSSSYKDITGQTLWGYSPIGAPIVASDGTVYLEYEVRHIDYPPRVTSAELWLMAVSPSGSVSSTQIATTTNDENLFPSRVIPDGQNGAIAVWRVAPSTGPLPQYPFRAARISAGVVSGVYNLPFSPVALELDDRGLPADPTLALGDNGTVFAAYGSQLAAFVNGSGSIVWSYSGAPQQASIISSTAGNGLVARLKDLGQGTDTILRFDASGAWTSEPWALADVQHFLDSRWFATSTSLQMVAATAFESSSSWASPDQDKTNQATQGLVVTNCSNSGPNQDAIVSVLQKMKGALLAPLDGACTAWMQQSGAYPATAAIDVLVGQPAVCHGTFDEPIAAFFGATGAIGLLPTCSLAVNDVGAFFREYDSRGEPWSFPGARYYRGNTLSQQAQTLIHEIGHFVPLAGIVPDHGFGPKEDAQRGKQNNKKVDAACRYLIEHLQ